MDGELYYWSEIADRTCIWSTSPTFLIKTFSNSPSHPPPPSPFLIDPGNRHDVGAKHWNISNKWQGKGGTSESQFPAVYVLFYFFFHLGVCLCSFYFYLFF